MALRITVDVFSGRPNPVIDLRGKEAKDALARLQPGRRLEKGEPGLPAEPTLGYRGLIVEQLDERDRKLPQVFRLANGDLFGPRLAHKALDQDFEDYICGSTGPLRKLKLGRNFPEVLRKEIARFRDLRAIYRPRPYPWRPKPSCRCEPLYEPAWWNDGGQKQFHNNCYNYATNYRSDTYAQPGRAAGAKWSALTCAAVKPAAVKDALIDSPYANNRCPGEGHLVALVVWPGGDYHWYRKGRNGRWSHKMGGSPVTNLDNSGVAILDPRTANRGPYTSFCTFMVVMHGHIKIS